MAEGRLNPSFTLLDEQNGVPDTAAPVVMGPPGFASPDPNTSRGVLVAIEEHPLSADLSPDYAADVYDNTDVHHTATSLGIQAEDPFAALPEDRDEWTNAEWQSVAKHYGLPVGGGKAKIRERVEAHEEEVDAAAQMGAQDWIELVNNSENADDLDALRSRYEESGADYKSVDAAFEKKTADFEEQQ